MEAFVKRFWVVFAVLAVGTVLVGYATNLAWSDQAESGATSKAPACISLKDVKFEIVGVTFVKRLDGVTNKFKQSHPEKYRGAVVTVRVTKPEDTKLCLYVADLPLHYRYGEDIEVAPCFGISTFSVRQDEDRLMRLFRVGYGRSATGLSTSKAKMVYVDIFYQNVEANTADVHLMVAQPSGASFKTNGWKAD